MIVAKKHTVLVGLCGNGHMLGPFFFDGNGNRRSYINVFNDEIIPLMTMLFQNQFHENRSERLWYTQYGQELLAVRARLEQLFWEKSLTSPHNTKWPPRSPDLTPFDFFLWGYLKEVVFRTPPESLNVLRQRLVTECNLLRETGI